MNLSSVGVAFVTYLLTLSRINKVCECRVDSSGSRQGTMVVQWWALVSTLMNLEVSLNRGDSMTGW
jgi:hypothetical protein